MTYDPDSLLGRLQTLPDPRRRQGRHYPLASLLGLLILAALHGESLFKKGGDQADSMGMLGICQTKHIQPSLLTASGIVSKS
jgi:hypothetical protein